MTTLGSKFVYRGKDYSIYITVSGDLSYSYQLIQTRSIEGGFMGVGYGFNSMKDAKQGLKYVRKFGYGSRKFSNWYDKKVVRPLSYRFGYLSFAQAKKIIGKSGIMSAYGEVAQRYKKRIREK